MSRNGGQRVSTYVKVSTPDLITSQKGCARKNKAFLLVQPVCLHYMFACEIHSKASNDYDCNATDKC